MARSFKTVVELQSGVEQACERAIKRACNNLLDVLQTLIRTEFYDQYDPVEYLRTEQFLRSATTQMLSKTCGQIFMDENAMNYKTISGRTQLLLAAEGYHGSPYIRRNGKFWNTFMDICDKYAIDYLKEELRQEGLNIK